MHIFHLLVFALFAWFAVATVWMLIKMTIITQDHLLAWAAKKVASAGSWTDKLVLALMAAPPAFVVVSALVKLVH